MMDNAVLLGLVLAIVTPLVTAAVSFGAIKASGRHTEKAIGRLESSIANFGARLGSVEGEVKVLQAIEQYKRRPTTDAVTP